MQCLKSYIHWCWGQTKIIVDFVSLFHILSVFFSVSFIFGALTCAAGVCGVSLGTMGAQFLRRYNSKADTLVCALGNLLSAPFLYFGFICAQNHVTVAWVSWFNWWKSQICIEFWIKFCAISNLNDALDFGIGLKRLSIHSFKPGSYFLLMWMFRSQLCFRCDLIISEELRTVEKRNVEKCRTGFNLPIIINVLLSHVKYNCTVRCVLVLRV